MYNIINNIGFKATNKDMYCRDHQFTLGEEYKYEGEIEICERGFHFCKKIIDIKNYYNIEKSRLFVVSHGDNYIECCDKCVTDTITLIEEITEENLKDIIKKYNIKMEDIIPYFYCTIIKILISDGIDIHAVNNALQWAAGKGHEDIVKLLLSKGADIHSNNDYALRLATKKGHEDIVKLLISKGADIHAESDSVLRYAAEYGHEGIVKFLTSKYYFYDKH